MPETISAIVGFVLPPFIDIINTKVTNSKVRFLISLAICLIIGLLSVGLTQGFDLNNIDTILVSGASAFTTAQLVYKQYYEDSKARVSLKRTLG
jgi:hypothetical protein